MGRYTRRATVHSAAFAQRVSELHRQGAGLLERAFNQAAEAALLEIHKALFLLTQLCARGCRAADTVLGNRTIEQLCPDSHQLTQRCSATIWMRILTSSPHLDRRWTERPLAIRDLEVGPSFIIKLRPFLFQNLGGLNPLWRVIESLGQFAYFVWDRLVQHTGIQPF
jgi:hypothetical protein